MLFSGFFILVALSVTLLMIFLGLFRREIYEDNKRVMFLLFMITLMTYLFLWVRRSNLFESYLVPICILPVIVRTFYDTRTALFTHIVSLLIIGFAAPQ